MPKREIKVTINLPTSEEGKARLQEALVAMNSRLIANVLNAHPEIPYEAKVRWIHSLNGVVPWATAAATEGMAGSMPRGSGTQETEKQSANAPKARACRAYEAEGTMA